MTSEQFFLNVSTELNAFLKSHGFNGSKNFWFKKAGVVNQLIELQKSAWSSSYYLNIGFIMAPDVVIKKKTPSHKWHYTCRFEDLTSWDNAKRNFYFGLEEEMNDEELNTKLKTIQTEFETSILPILDKVSGENYFKTNPNLNPLEKLWFLQNIKSEQLRELVNMD